MEFISSKEKVYFYINDIILYGGVLKKGFKNTKDIDIFVEVEEYESESDKIVDEIDFKEFLHEPLIFYGYDKDI